MSRSTVPCVRFAAAHHTSSCIGAPRRSSSVPVAPSSRTTSPSASRRPMTSIGESAISTPSHCPRPAGPTPRGTDAPQAGPAPPAPPVASRTRGAPIRRRTGGEAGGARRILTLVGAHVNRRAEPIRMPRRSARPRLHRSEEDRPRAATNLPEIQTGVDTNAATFYDTRHARTVRSTRTRHRDLNGVGRDVALPNSDIYQSPPPETRAGFSFFGGE